MSLSWRGMEDAHLKIPKQFLLHGCMHLSYQILTLGYLYSGCIYIYMYIYMYIYIYNVFLIFFCINIIYLYVYNIYDLYI